VLLSNSDIVGHPTPADNPARIRRNTRVSITIAQTTTELILVFPVRES